MNPIKTAGAVPARRRRVGRGLGPVVSVVVVAAVFGFFLPQLASYRGVWTTLSSMPWHKALLVAGVGAGNMIAYWIMIRAVLPALGWRQAAVLNLGPTAAANTLPAGEAAALGITWAMLTSWGISTRDYLLYTLVSGVFNAFAKLGLPILALALLALTGRPTTALLTAAITGLALLLAGAGGLGLALRDGPGHATPAAERLLALGFRMRHRPPPRHLGPALADFRSRTRALLAARGGRIALATATTHLWLALVLATCVYAGGVPPAQVPWPTILAAFALARLLSAVPVTPGGLGVVELSLTGFLAAGLDDPTTTKVTAAVLLFRAITYLLPIPLGAAAYLTWHLNHTPRIPRPTTTPPTTTGQRPDHPPVPDPGTGPPVRSTSRSSPPAPPRPAHHRHVMTGDRLV